MELFWGPLMRGFPLIKAQGGVKETEAQNRYCTVGEEIDSSMSEDEDVALQSICCA